MPSWEYFTFFLIAAITAVGLIISTLAFFMEKKRYRVYFHWVLASVFLQIICLILSIGIAVTMGIPLVSWILVYIFVAVYIAGWLVFMVAFMKIFTIEMMKAKTKKREPISDEDMEEFREDIWGKKVEKTGIPLLDEIFGEGIPAGYQTMILYDEGTYPQLFCLNFILEGLKNHQCCIYEATSRSYYRVKKFFRDLLDARKLDEKLLHNLCIVDYYSPRFSHHEKLFQIHEKLDEESAHQQIAHFAVDTRKISDVHSIIHEIWEDFVEAKMKKELLLRRVVDTLSTLVDTTDRDLVRQYLLHRIPAEGEIYWNTFYLVKKGIIDPNPESSNFESLLRDLVDIILELNMEEDENGNSYRTITLRKLRFKPFDPKPVKYRINDKFEILKSE